MIEQLTWFHTNAPKRAALALLVFAVSHTSPLAHAEDAPPTPAIKSALAQRLPLAVAAYKDGMAFLLGRDKPRDIKKAEEKFKEAAKLGLPHGNYGIACAIYQTGDHARTAEAFDNLADAANHNVLEAIAALAAYYWVGYGVPINPEKGVALLESAAAFAKHLPPGTGDPEYAYNSRPYYVERLIRENATSGLCAPPIRKVFPSWKLPQHQEAWLRFLYKPE